WLCQVMIEPRRARSLDVLLLTPTRDGYKCCACRPRQLAQSLGQLVAAHAWHADIQQKQLGAQLRGDLKRMSTRVRHGDFVAGKSEEECEAIGCVAVVVDDQDTTCVRAFHP